MPFRLALGAPCMVNGKWFMNLDLCSRRCPATTVHQALWHVPRGRCTARCSWCSRRKLQKHNRHVTDVCGARRVSSPLASERDVLRNSLLLDWYENAAKLVGNERGPAVSGHESSGSCSCRRHVSPRSPLARLAGWTARWPRLSGPGWLSPALSVANPSVFRQPRPSPGGSVTLYVLFTSFPRSLKINIIP